MTLDIDSDSPKTPDRVADKEQPTSALASSRVTIALRNAQRPFETIPSSPTSPSSPIPASLGRPGDVVRISIEESEAEMPIEAPRPVTPVTSPEDNSSPPVEIIDVHGDSDDGGYEPTPPTVTMLHDMHGGSMYGDPARDFPYRNAAETWPEAMTRIASWNTSCNTQPMTLAWF
jgi:hypothetical protein